MLEAIIPVMTDLSMPLVPPPPQPSVFETLKPPLNITVVRDLEGIATLGEFLARIDAVNFDTETNIVKTYFDRRIRIVQFGNRDEQYIVDLLELVGGNSDDLIKAQGDYGVRVADYPLLALFVRTVQASLESNRVLKVGHNLTFDYITTKWCLGLRPWHFWDTQLAEQVIHAGAVNFFVKGFWGLKDAALRYLRMELDKAQQTTFDLSSPLTPEQIAYAALDVRVPTAIMQYQKRIATSYGLMRAIQIENDAVPAFGDLHLNGLLIDMEKWRGLVAENEVKHKLNVAELDKHFIPVVGGKHVPIHDLMNLELAWRDEQDKTARAAKRLAFQVARRELKAAEKELPTFEGEAALNYASDDQLLAALRLDGFGVKKLPNTNDRSLKKLKGSPIIDAIREYRKTQKVKTTYGEGFLEKYVWASTGRVHSNISQLGAETGRTSSRAPNVQNILKGADWRACFISRPGHKILTIDYNGCELRILAELSKEPVWLEAFKQGWDVHSVGAEILFRDVWTQGIEPGCAYVTSHQKCSCKAHKKLRNRIKAVNFGLAYGMEAGKLSEELDIPLEDAEMLMNLYKGKFVIVTAYLAGSQMKALSTFESRTMSGRRRLFQPPVWDIVKAQVDKDYAKDSDEYKRRQTNRKYHAILAGIGREGKNTPIQGTNADIIKLAMGCGFDPDGNPYAWHLVEPLYKSAMENMVHDELVIESPDDQAEICYAAVANAMERAGAEFVKSIPMTTDGHIADRWVKD